MDSTAEPRTPAASPAGHPDGEDDLVDRSLQRTRVGDLVRYRHLLRNLVLKDLKLKYRGSVFGFLWSLANPLLMIVVYTVAFTYLLRIHTPGFVLYLMLGILGWTFSAGSLGMSTGAIADNGGLVKSVSFPRAILPAATVLFNLSQYVLTAIVFVPFLLVVYRVPPAAPMLLFPVFVALQTAFTIGLALLLATAAAFFRDVKHLVEVALAALFWATPIVYTIEQLPETVRVPIQFSPLASYIGAYHDIFYYRRVPGALTWGVTLGYAAAALAIGLAVTVKHEDRFTELV